MSRQPDHTPYVRRLVLPSGKTIDVVYYEEHPEVPVGKTTSRVDLCRCTSCDSALVYPIDWEEAGETHWEVVLRCPNCEWTGNGVFDQDVVERFDEELDRGTDNLVDDLKRLTAANMEEEVERFASALAADAILPEDF